MDVYVDDNRTMKPRITMLTIGVDDLDRSFAFYAKGLGLPSKGIVGKEFEHGAVAFFDLQQGLKLAIFPRASIAHDSTIRQTPPSATEFSIGHNVRSEAEVDAVMRQAEQAGATVIKPAVKTFWGGYAGFFADPDGHLWEIAYNPGLLPED
jgi:catechol 2,3-dioxygenase-like lactoylglutathione lyase family enzyme